VRAREVDDDRVVRRLEGRSVLVAEADEEHVGAARQRVGIRDECRQRAVQPDVESGCRLVGQRVRAERDDLEVRVGEHPVERLLPRVAGAADDRGGEQYKYYAELLIIMQSVRTAHL